MKQSHEKFLTKDKLKENAETWKYDTNVNEKNSGLYAFNRTESAEENNLNIIRLHGVSFIKDVIPKLIAGKKKGEKVKILDIGAGAAFFADEIREAFPDQVRVFSTGLSKKIAKDYRKKNKLKENQKLHPDDLKWRSILELSNFEEFDLIIDTFGEYNYGISESFTKNAAEGRAASYLTAVIKKLKPGGQASLVSNFNYFWTVEGKNFLEQLGEKHNVRITSPKELPNLLRIEKPK